jgi:hypothetical protein
MPTSISFGKRSEGSIIINGTTIVTIDVRVSESHNFSSKTTDYPIEDGSLLTDHVIVDPFSVGLNGIVSNTPLPKVGTEVSTTGNGERRSDVAYEALVTASRTKQSVVFESTLASYSGIITDLSFSKDSSTGESINFSATFREVRTGFVKRADPDTFPNENALAASIADRASTEKNNGSKRLSAWSEAQRRAALNQAEDTAGRNP